MSRNVGTADRIIRVVAGLVILSFAREPHTLWAYLGLIPLVTGLVGYCPAYKLLGLRTCPLAKTD